HRVHDRTSPIGTERPVGPVPIMILPLFNVILTSVLVSVAAWLSGKRPDLAGFIISLPLSTLIVLPMSHVEYGNAHTITTFAKSIMLAIPLSLTFFIPFLFAEKFKLGFWTCYLSGIACLCIGYGIHHFAFKSN